MKKNVSLCGMGCGPKNITMEVREAIRNAGLIIGSGRMLELCEEVPALKPQPADVRMVCEYRGDEIRSLIMDASENNIAVLYSGDVSLYSGAPTLYQELSPKKDIEARMLPGISVLSYFAARLAIPCQDIRVISAHGRDFDAAKAAAERKPLLFITSGEDGPSDICRRLLAAGLDDNIVTIGECLGYEDERIEPYDIDEVIGRKFAKLNVVFFWG